ncbi:MAG: hypothetical protein JWP87_4232 [Labilithrix sp.]|nr:hypothetical protein [Labilithrix sp.]
MRTKAAALLAALALLGVDRSARAAPESNVSLRGGYGTVWSSGVNYLNDGFGASIGHRFGLHLRVEVVALWSYGASVTAANSTIAYRSAYSSTQGSVGVGYEWRFGALRLRPGARAGAIVTDGYTRVGTATMHDHHWLPIIGPSVEAVVLVARRIELGVVGEAFFVPTWIAAPAAGVYGVAGVAF